MIMIGAMLAVHPAGVEAITLYVTVPGVAPVVVSVCEILLPLAAEAPDTPVEVIVQLNVEPAILLVNGIDVVPPEHKVVATGVADATGFGFTVIITGTGVPVQEFAVGTIL